MEALAKVSSNTAIKQSEKMCISNFDLQEPEIKKEASLIYNQSHSLKNDFNL